MDDRVPEHRDSHASSSHEVSLEPIFKWREDLGKHCKTQFPEDRNWEICKRTEITRAPCRRRNGEAVPRADKFWWLDNSRSCESRYNHLPQIGNKWDSWKKCKEWKKALLRYCCNQVWMKNGGQIPWNAIPICETFKISCLMGRLHTKDALENHLRDQSFRLVHCWVAPYNCERPVKNPSIWKESLTWIVSWIRSVRGENLEGWHDGCRPFEELETMDASEIYSKRLNAKEVIFPKEKGEFVFPVAAGRIKFVGTDQELRTSTLIRQRPIRGESHLDFLGESDGRVSSTTSWLVSRYQWSNYWLSVHVRKNIIYRHHVEPRVKLYSPREESFPIPLKYIDVSRTTHTNLDVTQESRIDDYWNIDGSTGLSDSGTGFTQLTLWSEELLEGFLWSGERLTKRQATSRLDHLRPELWRGMSRKRWAEGEAKMVNWKTKAR